MPAGKFQQISELALKGINSEAPAKKKENPQEGISRGFHSRKGSSLRGGFDGSYPQPCAGIITLVQHDRHRERGVGALAEFGGIQKKVDILEWLNSTILWVDRPSQKEEGQMKSDRHGMGASPSCRGGGRDAVFYHGLEPQLRIMERLGDMTGLW